MLPWQPNFGQHRLKSHKMATPSVVSETSMQSLVLGRVCAIREFICVTPLHKRQRGVTMATNFEAEIAINAYKCISMRDNENAMTRRKILI